MNFMSPVEKIDHLYINPLPAGKVLNVEKVIRVGNITVFATKNGKLYSPNSRRVSYMLGKGDLTTSFMNAMHKLGAITKAQMDEHLKAAEAASKRREARHVADDLRNVKAFGIKLTKKQEAFLAEFSPKKIKADDL